MRETLEQRRTRAEAGLKAVGFTKGKKGLWTRDNQTARIIEEPATHKGGPVPDEINGKPVPAVYFEPKVRIEYGER